MKYYNGKHRKTGIWETFEESQIEDYAYATGEYDTLDEAQDCLGELADEVEYQNEQAEEQYYEENRDAIVQQERYEAFRNEY